MPRSGTRGTTPFSRLVATKQWDNAVEKMRADTRELMRAASDERALLHAAHRAVAVEDMIEVIDRHAANETAKPLPKFEAV